MVPIVGERTIDVRNYERCLVPAVRFLKNHPRVSLENTTKPSVSVKTAQFTPLFQQVLALSLLVAMACIRWQSRPQLLWRS